jgi:hypothetical protein
MNIAPELSQRSFTHSFLCFRSPRLPGYLRQGDRSQLRLSDDILCKTPIYLLYSVLHYDNESDTANFSVHRFSKTVATGMRVPRKTQAPLTFPGMLSTAGHWDQSSADMKALLSSHRTPARSSLKGRERTRVLSVAVVSTFRFRRPCCSLFLCHSG